MSTFLVTAALVLTTVWIAEVAFVLFQYHQTPESDSPSETRG